MCVGSVRERPATEGPKGVKPSAEETKNPSWKEIYYALSNSPRPHSENGRLDSLSKSDAAKLQKISDNLQATLQEMSVQRL